MSSDANPPGAPEKPEAPLPDKPVRKATRNTSAYARYSSLAFQMLGTILCLTYAGYRLDLWQQNEIPVWTLVLSLASIAASLYLFIRNAGN